jgi:ubiquinone/menaquinone biosynthesis C-methylase UbiE
MPDYAALTARQKAVWSSGDWPAVAPTITDASAEVVDAIGVGPDQDFLDVATGSGTAAIMGAQRGARTTGLDFVPELIDAARAAGTGEGVEVEWVVGDAQDLPFEDDSFDRVSSVFGAMFAPDQAKAAAELVRVCRPGGMIGVAAWTPEGVNGQMFATLGGHMPPPPEGFQPPVLWGTEDRVRELFAGQDVQTSRHMVRFEDDDVEEFFPRWEEQLGPLVMARKALEPEGKWEAARDAVRDLFRSVNQRSDGGLAWDAEYQLTVVRPR